MPYQLLFVAILSAIAGGSLGALITYIVSEARAEKQRDWLRWQADEALSLTARVLDEQRRERSGR